MQWREVSNLASSLWLQYPTKYALEKRPLGSTAIRQCLSVARQNKHGTSLKYEKPIRLWNGRWKNVKIGCRIVSIIMFVAGVVISISPNFFLQDFSTWGHRNSNRYAWCYPMISRNLPKQLTSLSVTAGERLTIQPAQQTKT